METKIIKEIDSFSSKYHINVGLLFFVILLLVFIIFKNLDEKGIKFIANFMYGKLTSAVLVGHLIFLRIHEQSGCKTIRVEHITN